MGRPAAVRQTFSLVVVVGDGQRKVPKVPIVPGVPEVLVPKVLGVPGVLEVLEVLRWLEVQGA
jgi:hypothetical protein